MRKSANRHGTNEELLSLLDGELGSRDLPRVGKHVEHCSECRERLAQIESRMAEAVAQHTPAMDAAGPHALLKARLAELSRDGVSGAPARQWTGWMRGLAFACALALLAVTGAGVFWHEAAKRATLDARLLPDPRMTPGATRYAAMDEICSKDGDDVVRSVPAQLKEKVFREYGIANVPAAEFEVDYLITPGLGGSDDVRNLWPEPHANTLWNSYVKDQLEDRLHRMVCGGEIPLDQAQREIAGNWIAAYKKYFHTQQPLGNTTGAVQMDLAARRKQRRS